MCVHRRILLCRVKKGSSPRLQQCVLLRQQQCVTSDKSASPYILYIIHRSSIQLHETSSVLLRTRNPLRRFPSPYDVFFRTYVYYYYSLQCYILRIYIIYLNRCSYDFSHTGRLYRRRLRCRRLCI